MAGNSILNLDYFSDHLKKWFARWFSFFNFSRQKRSKRPLTRSIETMYLSGRSTIRRNILVKHWQTRYSSAKNVVPILLNHLHTVTLNFRFLTSHSRQVAAHSSRRSAVSSMKNREPRTRGNRARFQGSVPNSATGWSPLSSATL